MSAKASNFLSAHYPNTYMEQFCMNLHPDFELGSLCVSWFREAAKHCSDLLNNNRLPRTYFWNTVKNFIFPDHSTELVSKKVPISIHPKRLRMQDCQSLFLDIVNDYIERAPRYAAESITNVMLWQVLYSLMGIMVLGSLLMGIIFSYNKYGQSYKKCNPLNELFKTEKCLQAAAKRSLCLAKAEIRNIRIKPIAKPEHILPADGSAVMALKVFSKYEILETVVSGYLQSTGKLHRLHDEYNKTKADFRIESLTKAMTFLDNNCNKLHLLLMFEDSPEFEETVDFEKRSASRLIKDVSPRRIPSPKLATDSSKRITNCKILAGGRGGMPPVKQVSTTRSSNSVEWCKSSPRRSVGVLNTGIPCKALKQSSTVRKSK